MTLDIMIKIKFISHKRKIEIDPFLLLLQAVIHKHVLQLKRLRCYKI